MKSLNRVPSGNNFDSWEVVDRKAWRERENRIGVKIEGALEICGISALAPPHVHGIYLSHTNYRPTHGTIPSTKHVRALISAELDHATTYTQVGGREGNSCQRTSVFALNVVCVPMESRIHACMKGSHVRAGRFFGIIVLRIEGERLKHCI